MKKKKDAKEFLIKELETLNVKEIIFLINELFQEEMNNHPIVSSAWLKGELK